MRGVGVAAWGLLAGFWGGRLKIVENFPEKLLERNDTIFFLNKTIRYRKKIVAQATRPYSQKSTESPEVSVGCRKCDLNNSREGAKETGESHQGANLEIRIGSGRFAMSLGASARMWGASGVVGERAPATIRPK